jgi:hypothetical protein
MINLSNHDIMPCFLISLSPSLLRKVNYARMFEVQSDTPAETRIGIGITQQVNQ